METEDQGVSEGTEQAAPDTEYDEGKAFEAETKEDKAEEMGLDVDELEEEEAEPEKKVAVKKEGEGKAEAKAEEDPGEESDEDDEETDEDVIRGKELLAADKEAADAKAAGEAAVEQRPAERMEYSPFQATNTAGDLEFFKSIFPKNLFPKEPVMVDGEELDFGYYQKENPEFVPAVMAITKNIIDQMLANNALVGGGVYDHVAEQLFLRTVERDVPKAKEIHNSTDFQKWLPSQPETIQALMKSETPSDHVRVFNRFLNKEGLGKAKDKIINIDKKRGDKKKAFDKIHKTTVKSRKASQQSVVDNDALEEEGFMSKDDDDIDY